MNGRTANANETEMENYLKARRGTTVSARLTVADRRLLEAAAAERGAPSLSAYVAQVATEAARRDLLGVDRREQAEA